MKIKSLIISTLVIAILALTNCTTTNTPGGCSGCGCKNRNIAAQ